MDMQGSPLRIYLFVAGDAPSSRVAKQVLETLTADMGDGIDLEQEIVDVLREPARALQAKLLATPTLIIEEQDCTHRFVGNLQGRRDLAQLIASYRASPE